MIPEEVSLSIQKFLSDSGQSSEFVSVAGVTGGCINACFRLKTPTDNFFLKYNRSDSNPGMFSAEAKGLDMLRRCSSLKIPEVLLQGKSSNYSFLILEWLEEGRGGSSFEKALGIGMADLHRITHRHFGLDHSNYIGSLAQVNTETEDWPSFFFSFRLQPMIERAFEMNLLETRDIRAFERLERALPDIFPEVEPSLVHGDLWSGNKMPTDKGLPAIFDPAVYFGNREMDIAMTKLFGGFGKEFYESYLEAFPMETGWEERFPICNLYPLLIHLILFGKSYYGDIESVLRKF